MILYVEILKAPEKKKLGLINSLKLQNIKSGYKNQLHLYTPTTNHLKENQENNPIYDSIKKNKISLTKELKDLYSENYKMIIEEIKEDKNKWKGMPSSWTGNFILLKWPYYPK